MTHPHDTPLRARLRTALATALKTSDADAASALRSALSAIDNAESVEQSVRSSGESPIAGAVVGLGAGDVPRRVLSEDEVSAIVEATIRDLESAAEQYEELGDAPAAARARSQADLLAQHMVPSGS